MSGQVGTNAPAAATSGSFKMLNGLLNAGTITLASTSFATALTSATVSTGTFTQNSGAVLADNVLLDVPAAASGALLTNIAVYNIGTTSTASVLSAASISMGTSTANTASRATINFINGTIANYDAGSNGFAAEGNAISGGAAVSNLVLSGITGGGFAINNTTLNIALAAAGVHNLCRRGQSIDHRIADGDHYRQRCVEAPLVPVLLPLKAQILSQVRPALATGTLTIDASATGAGSAALTGTTSVQRRIRFTIASD